MEVMQQNEVRPNGTGTRRVLSLDELIRELHVLFAEDSVNVERVHELMASYQSNPEEWECFSKFDRQKYTRNLVDEGNGKFNLMILCWNHGNGSAIHDHSNAHCFMKVLEGSLSEIRFAMPEEDREESGGLKVISRSHLGLNDVCYINDSMGLHRVENTMNRAAAVSLHLYCPPFDTCHIYSLKGQKSLSKVTFWSTSGDRRSRDVQNTRDPEDN